MQNRVEQGPQNSCASKPRVLAVHVAGRDRRDFSDVMPRAQLLRGVAAWACALPDGMRPDAILLPGGFGFAAHPDFARDSAYWARHPLGRAAGDALSALADRDGGTPDLVMGVDTGPYHHRGMEAGGQQLALAFRTAARGGVDMAGFARKVFPVTEDVDGRKWLPMILHESDYDDPARMVTLRTGHRALLNVCYDMFGLGDTLRGNAQKLLKAVHVVDRDGRVIVDSAARGHALQTAFSRYASMLAREKPDLALGCIHRFDGAGRDAFWQRHGIATASAALGVLSGGADGFAVAAAHARALPATDAGLRLAALGVGVDHMDAGGRRASHALKPVLHHRLDAGGMAAVLRLF